MGAGGKNAAKEAIIYRDVGFPAEAVGQSLGLVEFALAQFCRIQGDWDNEMPLLSVEVWLGLVDKEFGEESFEPKGAVVFIAMDDIEDLIASNNGSPGVTEMKFAVAAIGTFEGCGNRPFKRKPASLAKRWLNESYLLATFFTDVTFDWGCSRAAA